MNDDVVAFPYVIYSKLKLKFSFLCANIWWLHVFHSNRGDQLVHGIYHTSKPYIESIYSIVQRIIIPYEHPSPLTIYLVRHEDRRGMVIIVHIWKCTFKHQ